MNLEELHNRIKRNFIGKQNIDVIEILGMFNEEFNSSVINIELKSNEIKKTIIEVEIEKSGDYFIIKLGEEKLSLDSTKDDLEMKLALFIKYLNNILEQEKIEFNNQHILNFVNGKSSNSDYIQVLKRDINIDNLLK